MSLPSWSGGARTRDLPHAPECVVGMPTGVVHRLDGWERSPAREAAEGLEG